jgi:hypothetical protein
LLPRIMKNSADPRLPMIAMNASATRNFIIASIIP